MIDREKVVSVLRKRFPMATPLDVAAAANAIVGLEPEYELVDASEISALDCVTDRARYQADDLETGRLRVYRRLDEEA